MQCKALHRGIMQTLADRTVDQIFEQGTGVYFKYSGNSYSSTGASPDRY